MLSAKQLDVGELFSTLFLDHTIPSSVLSSQGLPSLIEIQLFHFLFVFLFGETKHAAASTFIHAALSATTVN